MMGDLVADRCPASAGGPDVSGDGTAEVPQGGETMKYMILMYGSQRDYDAMAGKAADMPALSPEDFAPMHTFMESFATNLMETGELVDTQGLAAPVHTRRVQLRSGVPVVTDGPYPETQEVLAGYWIVDCASFDRATEIAAGLADCPSPGDMYADSVVDVRPIADSRDELEL
jgi:hypothetical protein